MAKFQLNVENKIEPTKDQIPEQAPISEYAVEKDRAYGTRRYLYRPLYEQLDMLWHDIDSGKIQADTTSANTWYQHIKSVKEFRPLPDANTFPS